MAGVNRELCDQRVLQLRGEALQDHVQTNTRDLHQDGIVNQTKIKIRDWNVPSRGAYVLPADGSDRAHKSRFRVPFVLRPTSGSDCAIPTELEPRNRNVGSD